jgi:hypothetical protein
MSQVMSLLGIKRASTMKRGSQRIFLFGIAGMILALCSRPALFAQTTGVSVPFVGCPSSGQIEELEAPKGKARSLPVSAKDARALAYYKSADGIAVLAPRGSYCQGDSGSGGYGLFVSPKPIDRSKPGWDSIDGPGIDINHITGGASGRYEIAEIMARVYPAYRDLARRVLEPMDFSVPAGPYPGDVLTYRGEDIVEFITPAQTEGLGTHFSWLKKNDSPVAGAAIITGESVYPGDPPNVVLLSVRLPADLARLTPVIVRYVERDTAGAPLK